MAELTASFEKATAEKLKCQQEADNTAKTINLANRLVGGLASENVRWAEAVEKFKEQGTTLPGDVLLTSAFISYVGSFSKSYREDLLSQKWLPFISSLKVPETLLHITVFSLIVYSLCWFIEIARLLNLFNCTIKFNCCLFFKVPIPLTEDLDVLSLLTDNATVAQWNNENLPSDRMSTENATILVNAERWPLMIDPQLQGIKWIKTKEGEELKVVKIGNKGYLLIFSCLSLFVYVHFVICSIVYWRC